MSICSEDQCSLLASSPEESCNVTLNNNTNSQQGTGPPSLPEGSTSSTTDVNTNVPRPGPNNENVRVVHLKRGLKPGDPPEICTVPTDVVVFGEERESIL
uniref:Uncharacterized protein n=1 Tax=Oryzias latipes TaxID=8090 RepID=A0A3P9J803_ORYLA